jgi:hypothetical protein
VRILFLSQFGKDLADGFAPALTCCFGVKSFSPELKLDGGFQDVFRGFGHTLSFLS